MSSATFIRLCVLVRAGQGQLALSVEIVSETVIFMFPLLIICQMKCAVSLYVNVVNNPRINKLLSQCYLLRLFLTTGPYLNMTTPGPMVLHQNAELLLQRFSLHLSVVLRLLANGANLNSKSVAFLIKWLLAESSLPLNPQLFLKPTLMLRRDSSDGDGGRREGVLHLAAGWEEEQVSRCVSTLWLWC